jgi:mRNA interferase MazF
MVMAKAIRRGEIYMVDLDPTLGGEIKKARPCLIISPDELNAHLRTFIVAPLTTGSHSYPFRIPCGFAGRKGHIVLDQIRTVDRERLVRRLGKLSPSTLNRVFTVSQEMFSQ